eukprot:m.191812 g.191812  ORF g.191812 m.191812 type:complete len:367 (-) comp18460_c0_seq1:46-1146(-)
MSEKFPVSVRTLEGRKESLPVTAKSTSPELLTVLVERGLAVPGSRLVRIGGKTRKDDVCSMVALQHIVELMEGDELLVLAPPAKKPLPSNAGNRPPKLTAELLQEASKDVPPSDPDRNGVSEDVQANEQPLGQLIEVVRHLLSIARTLQAALDEGKEGTDGEDTAGGAAAEDEEPEEAADPYKDVDEHSLKFMMDMGFPEMRSKKALVLNRMDLEQAMEWLLQHNEDDDIDEPLVVPKVQRTASGSFHPDPIAFRGLTDMGFGERDVLAALQLSHNNFQLACDWLLSGRDVHAALEKQLSQALNDSNPLIQAVLADPHVQSCLVDARIRRALETLVVNPQNAAALMSDPIVRDVILFLSQLIARVS